jgi:hypothetical protein
MVHLLPVAELALALPGVASFPAYASP